MALSTLQPTSIVTTASTLTTATTAYVTGDMLGAEMTMTNAAASSGGRGVITAITLENSSNNVQLGASELWIFNVASGAAADNGAATWTDAQIRTCVLAGIPLAAPITITAAGNQMLTTGNLWLPFTTSGSANLFLNHVTRSGHTFFTAATDLQYTFEILQWV